MLLLGVPAAASAMSSIEFIDLEQQSVTITVTEDHVRVTGANGQVMTIYNVTGMLVRSVRIEGADKRVELNLPKGCYIVKVGNVTRKVSVK